nr:C20orf197 protein [Homo sapiens]|eukprot:NP_001289744.1 uncharacterized protein C20orf197 isoform b [Homo sapiens]
MVALFQHSPYWQADGYGHSHRLKQVFTKQGLWARSVLGSAGGPASPDLHGVSSHGRGCTAVIEKTKKHTGTFRC